MSKYKGEKWVRCVTEEDFDVQQWPAVLALLVELGIDHSTMVDSIKSIVYGVLGYIAPHSDYDREGQDRDPWFSKNNCCNATVHKIQGNEKWGLTC